MLSTVQDLNTLSTEQLFHTLNTHDIVGRLIALAGEEDLGAGGKPGDVTTQCCIPPRKWADGVIVAREAGVLAGMMTIPRIMMMLAGECQYTFQAQDGQAIRKHQTVGTLSGPMYQVLRAERLTLNILGRLSGIATRTAEFAKRIEGTGVRLLDTRKTTPGWRALEKYAVRCGGGYCHRSGLHDAVLFKDNHIFGVPVKELAGWVRAAVERARLNARKQESELRFIELEVDTLEQLEAVLGDGAGDSCNVDIVLLDNMTTDQLREAVKMRKRFGSRVLLESSGGVTLETVRGIAETGVDRISVGGLTHHAVSLDMAMDVQWTNTPERVEEDEDEEEEGPRG